MKLAEESKSAPPGQQILGGLMVLAGASVFLIRMQHAGPYGAPTGGNLFGAVLALVLGAALFLWKGGRRPMWAMVAASLPVLFFALYSTLAEMQEVVVLKATTTDGEPADLRLWVVDHHGAAWVAMPRAKADAHGLGEGNLQLLRQGVVYCVTPQRSEDRDLVNGIHSLRHRKYFVQRLATSIGIFGRTAAEDTLVLRLVPCAGTRR